MSKFSKFKRDPSMFFRDSWLNIWREKRGQTKKSPGQIDTAQYAFLWENKALDDKIILYESFHGNTMSCSPMALFKRISSLSEFEGYNHVWALNDRFCCSVEHRHLKNVEFVKVHSDEYLRYLCSSKYLINNTSFPSYFVRKPGQVYLNTWHGSPLKTLGRHQQGTKGQHRNLQRNFVQATHILSQSAYMSEKLMESHDLDGIYAGKLLELGYPRIDITLSTTREAVRKKLVLNSEKPVLLFAPTWRGEVGSVSGINMRLMADLEILCKTLQDKYEIFFRGHVLEQKQIAKMPLPCRVVSDNIDTNELLAGVDYLVTDYSSIFFDYLVQKKPVSLYVYDQKEYIRDRGLYFDLEEIPAYKCSTLDELTDSVIKGNWHRDFCDVYDAFKKKFLYLDDGFATERTIDAIWHNANEYVKPPHQEGKTTLLFYCGGFGSNGITTSAINLFDSIDYNRHNVILVENGDTDADRQYNLEKLSPKVKVFYRVGRCNTLPNEEKILKKYYDSGRLSEQTEKILRQHFNREQVRLLGDTKIDVAVDFSGYVKFWTLLFSFSDAHRRVIYQHNDMMAENDKQINGRYKHRKNFKVIFDAYKWFDKIVSVSKNTRDLNYSSLRSFVDQPDEKFAYVTNTINKREVLRKSKEDNRIVLNGEDFWHDEYERGTTAINLTLYKRPPENMIKFIHIGRFSPEKRHDKLLAAFRYIKNIRDDVMLYLLGSGPLFKSTQRLAVSLGLSNSVVFMGQIRNPYSIIAKCDCFVLSSDHEGQPMVLLECLVLGKPVVATDIVGSRSVLGDSEGKLVPNTIEGLVQGMLDFLEGKVHPPQFDFESYRKETMSLFYQEVCGVPRRA